MSVPNRSILYDSTTLQGLDKEMWGDEIQIALRMTVIAKMREREREREERERERGERERERRERERGHREREERERGKRDGGTR